MGKSARQGEAAGQEGGPGKENKSSCIITCFSLSKLPQVQGLEEYVPRNSQGVQKESLSLISMNRLTYLVIDNIINRHAHSQEH